MGGDPRENKFVATLGALATMSALSGVAAARIRSDTGQRFRTVRINVSGYRPGACARTVDADVYYWMKLYRGSGGHGWTAEPYLHDIDYS